MAVTETGHLASREVDDLYRRHGARSTATRTRSSATTRTPRTSRRRRSSTRTARSSRAFARESRRTGSSRSRATRSSSGSDRSRRDRVTVELDDQHRGPGGGRRRPERRRAAHGALEDPAAAATGDRPARVRGPLVRRDRRDPRRDDELRSRRSSSARDARSPKSSTHQLTCTEAQLAISRSVDGRLGRKERRRRPRPPRRVPRLRAVRAPAAAPSHGAARDSCSSRFRSRSRSSRGSKAREPRAPRPCRLTAGTVPAPLGRCRRRNGCGRRDGDRRWSLRGRRRAQGSSCRRCRERRGRCRRDRSHPSSRRATAEDPAGRDQAGRSASDRSRRAASPCPGTASRAARHGAGTDEEEPSRRAQNRRLAKSQAKASQHARELRGESASAREARALRTPETGAARKVAAASEAAATRRERQATPSTTRQDAAERPTEPKSASNGARAAARRSRRQASPAGDSTGRQAGNDKAGGPKHSDQLARLSDSSPVRGRIAHAGTADLVSRHAISRRTRSRARRPSSSLAPTAAPRLLGEGRAPRDSRSGRRPRDEPRPSGARPPARCGRRRACAPPRAAIRRSMLELGFFGHESADGTAFSERIRRHYTSRGWRTWSVGEALLASQGTTSTPTRSSTPGSSHRRIGRSSSRPTWRDAGIGALYASDAPNEFGGTDDDRRHRRLRPARGPRRAS